MPGRRSLEVGEYYAHPRNDFWPIIFSLLQTPQPQSYQARIDEIKKRGIALWDVLATCTRENSADQTIACPETHDFEQLFVDFPGIQAVFFNGRKAEEIFQAQGFSLPPGTISSYLPSTSPAHTLIRTDKLKAWKMILNYLPEVK